MCRPVLIGITGSIGAGKSTLATMLAERGAVVVDADEVTHQVLEHSDVKKAVVDAFGSSVVDEQGRISRPALGTIVFDDPEQRDLLMSILRPGLEGELWRRLEVRATALRQQSQHGVVILDAPLIVEWGIQNRLDRIVVVVAKADVASRRLQRSRGMSAAEVAARARAQAPDADKVAAADVVVDNSGGFEELERAADALWNELTKGSSTR